MLIAHCKKHLGFNHVPFNDFFLFSQPSHLSIFHLYAVASLTLGFSSNSTGFSNLLKERALHYLTQCFVGSRCDNIGIPKGRRMVTSSNKTSYMSHIYHYIALITSNFSILFNQAIKI